MSKLTFGLSFVCFVEKENGLEADPFVAIGQLKPIWVQQLKIATIQMELSLVVVWTRPCCLLPNLFKSKVSERCINLCELAIFTD